MRVYIYMRPVGRIFIPKPNPNNIIKLADEGFWPA